MKSESNYQLKSNVSKVAGLILAVGLVVAPAALANSQSKIASADYVKVLSHVDIPTGPATRMQVVEQNKRQYLYIATNNSSQPVVLDVTKPGRTSTVEPAQLAGANLATAVAQSTADAPEILALLNADAQVPTRVTHKFSSSARFVEDDKRGLIYVADNDGLWIVKAEKAFDYHQALIDTYY